MSRSLDAGLWFPPFKLLCQPLWGENMKYTHAFAALTAVVALAPGPAACESLDTDQPGTAADRADTKNAAKKDAQTADNAASTGKPGKGKPAAPKETGGQAQA